MLKLVAATMVLAVAAAGLARTNPGEDAHRRTVVRHVQARCGDNLFVRALCGGVVEFAATNLHYDDYLLFSTGRLGEMETFGALGGVVVVKED